MSVEVKETDNGLYHIYYQGLMSEVPMDYDTAMLHANRIQAGGCIGKNHTIDAVLNSNEQIRPPPRPIPWRLCIREANRDDSSNAPTRRVSSPYNIDYLNDACKILDKYCRQIREDNNILENRENIEKIFRVKRIVETNSIGLLESGKLIYNPFDDFKFKYKNEFQLLDYAQFMTKNQSRKKYQVTRKQSGVEPK